MTLVLNWIILTLAVIVGAYVLPGVRVVNFFSALAVALVLGLLNTFIKPVISLLLLPVNILTLGLFSFVINALFIVFIAALVPGFTVQNFWWALLFSVVISLVVFFLSGLV